MDGWILSDHANSTEQWIDFTRDDDCVTDCGDYEVDSHARAGGVAERELG